MPDGPLTVEAWIRADAWRERTGVLCKTESAEFGLFANGGVPDFIVHLGGRYVSAKAEAAIPIDRWTHVAGVFDGAEVRVYLDGQLVASAPGAGKRTLNRLPLVVGGDVGGSGKGGSTLDGGIDEVRLSRGARYMGPRFTPARRLEADGDTVLLLQMEAAFGPILRDPPACGTRLVGRARLADG